MQAQKTLSQAISTEKQLSGCNYEQMAEKLGVGKTTLYRAASGNWKRTSRKILELAETLGVELQPKADPKTCHIILDAIEDVWDGTESHAKAIASLLKATDRVINLQKA